MGWNEDRLHRWLGQRPIPAALGGRSGHDAAVLKSNPARSVQCSDQCIEGVHFEPGTRGRDVGRKAANRALSDLAASAARPQSILLSIAACAGTSEAWLRALIEGASQAAENVGACLAGGDLARCPAGVVVTVAAYGHLPGRAKAPARDRARAGQCVVLSGPVGGSLLGRHLRFEPPVAAGLELHAAGASAMMDVSDGLAWDLHRLARSSGVRIDLERVPLHRDAVRRSRASGRSPLYHGLHDGEDHVLIACLPERVRPDWALPIGKVRRGSGLWLSPAASGDALTRRWQPQEGGWKHDA